MGTACRFFSIPIKEQANPVDTLRSCWHTPRRSGSINKPHTGTVRALRARKRVMRIAIIACSILKLELDKILEEIQFKPEVLYLDAALHIQPANMRAKIVEQVNALAHRVDAVFLGYGTCQSLDGIETECRIPVLLPKADDCISLLLGIERYAEEVKKETGTWFMTPGWAEVGARMVIRELHLDRVVKYGKDPMEMARRLFTHYRRGLLIDTGVGDKDENRANAVRFCTDFGLTLEETQSACGLLRQWVLKARDLALEQAPETRKP